MVKNVKCLLLKNNQVIVSEVEEISSELGEPDCRIINPYRIDGDCYLTLWPDVTDQREIMIHSDSILTIVDPKPKIVEKYFELTGK